MPLMGSGIDCSFEKQVLSVKTLCHTLIWRFPSISSQKHCIYYVIKKESNICFISYYIIIIVREIGLFNTTIFLYQFINVTQYSVNAMLKLKTFF